MTPKSKRHRLKGGLTFLSGVLGLSGGPSTRSTSSSVAGRLKVDRST